MAKNEHGPLVTVDAEKLKWGLRSTYIGMALVVESIRTGADSLKISRGLDESSGSFLAPTVDTDGAEADAVSERNSTIGNIPSPGIPEQDTVTNLATKPKSEPAPVPERPQAEPQSQTGMETGTETETETDSTLTIHDIIRVAAKKIETNRKNSEKIGKMVKTYGLASLKELPPARFEEFMTELSQI